MSLIKKEFDFAGRPMIFEIGQLAPQANCAVRVQYGETVVLVTAVAGGIKEDLGYFPLTVDYEEKYYAGGRISTSRFIKRETKPKDEAILKGRLIDRSIRPLFPKDYLNETQVIITVLSVDKENDPDIVGLAGVIVALSLSNIPWNGPLGGVRVAQKDGQFVVNPKNEELDLATLDLVVSGTKDHIVMVEAGATEVSEANLVEALKVAQEQNSQFIDFVNDFVKEAGQAKMDYETKTIDEEIKKQIVAFIADHASEALFAKESVERESASAEFLDKIYVQFEGKLAKEEMKEIFEDEVKHMIRENIVEKEVRPDGRKLTEVRPITINVGVLPRTHGSGLFQRGLTQILSVVTLGSTSLQQLIEGMEGEEKKRYIHHYNFPPYSVGEVSRMGAPSRRSIGHGALAEKALRPMIPDKDVFPYTIRVVSECLSSAGSTSMGSVCGSTLSLMDAGVPLKKPVAGVAMGVVFKDDKYKVLTDIQALEDFYGDMDFKVAGTRDGITAIQLDVKTIKLTVDILAQALNQAREGRLFIMDKMLAVIAEPRPALSQYAPKVEIVKIDPKKIGELIGPGGKTINKIIEATGTEIDIEEDGTVNISGETKESLDEAVRMVKGLTEEITIGSIYEGTVVKLFDFGAIVEVLPGKSGMVHISQIRNERVNKIADVLKVGQKVTVKAVEVDSQGRINLTMKIAANNNGDRPNTNK